jgi:uncharacterized membrane protein
MDDELYIEIDTHIELLKKCEYIREEKEVKKLCDKAKEILSQEGNVINLNAPITVIIFEFIVDMWRYTWSIS